jgi:hypothetical protein
MMTNQTPPDSRSPIPNAKRTSYYDHAGEEYYTQWQLDPDPNTKSAGPGGDGFRADLARVLAEHGYLLVAQSLPNEDGTIHIVARRVRPDVRQAA